MFGFLFMAFSMLSQPAPPAPTEDAKPNQSAYFAFVDREYIFTVEMVKPGIPLLNFVSISDKERNLVAKEIRLILDDRTAPGQLFIMDTGNPKEPVKVSSLQVHPRSSFGFRLGGDFGKAEQLRGVRIRFGGDEFSLVPLSSLDFESLVLKVNRLNLDSPDINDDWRVLKLQTLGGRAPLRGRISPE